MPGDDPVPLRSKVLEFLNWIFVLLVWVIYLAVVGLWELSGALRGYTGRRRLRTLAFGIPLLALALAAWKLVPIAWARLVLLDQASFAARRSMDVDSGQVQSNLRAQALRLGFEDIQEQPEAIEVEKVEEEGISRCRVRVHFTHGVHLFRWTWTVPIRGSVDQVVLPKIKNPYAEGNVE